MTARIAPLVLAAVAAASCGSEPAPPLKLTVLTFNVFCSFCDTEKQFDPWAERLDDFGDILARHDPDIFGIEELFTPAETEEILQRRPGFAVAYFHDPDEKFVVDYPDAAVFYRESRFELVESGTYWLSETPDKPWSGGWAGGQIWRLVTWTRLRVRGDGREIYLAATHFDNNAPNQEHSAPIVVARTASQAAARQTIVLGDFNSNPSTTAYGTLVRGVDGAGFALKDAHDLAATAEVVHNQPQPPEYDASKRIDHVFLAGPSAWNVSRWRVDLYRYGAQARYPSDHFAISADLSF